VTLSLVIKRVTAVPASCDFPLIVVGLQLDLPAQTPPAALTSLIASLIPLSSIARTSLGAGHRAVVADEDRTGGCGLAPGATCLPRRYRRRTHDAQQTGGQGRQNVDSNRVKRMGPTLSAGDMLSAPVPFGVNRPMSWGYRASSRTTEPLSTDALEREAAGTACTPSPSPTPARAPTRASDRGAEGSRREAAWTPAARVTPARGIPPETSTTSSSRPSQAWSRKAGST
jgi:hypothetical protein